MLPPFGKEKKSFILPATFFILLMRLNFSKLRITEYFSNGKILDIFILLTGKFVSQLLMRNSGSTIFRKKIQYFSNGKNIIFFYILSTGILGSLFLSF